MKSILIIVKIIRMCVEDLVFSDQPKVEAFGQKPKCLAQTKSNGSWFRYTKP